MARRNRFGSHAVQKEFVQASMRFVVTNYEEDGGCQMNHDGYFDEEIADLKKYGLWSNLKGT